jgi:hypothetical protein
MHYISTATTSLVPNTGFDNRRAVLDLVNSASVTTSDKSVADKSAKTPFAMEQIRAYRLFEQLRSDRVYCSLPTTRVIDSKVCELIAGPFLDLHICAGT